MGASGKKLATGSRSLPPWASGKPVAQPLVAVTGQPLQNQPGLKLTLDSWLEKPKELGSCGY